MIRYLNRRLLKCYTFKKNEAAQSKRVLQTVGACHSGTTVFGVAHCICQWHMPSKSALNLVVKYIFNLIFHIVFTFLDVLILVYILFPDISLTPAFRDFK